VQPSQEYWNEVTSLTSHINDSTLRFIMQNQLIYCPHLPTCSNIYSRQYRPGHESCCYACSCSRSCLQEGSCCPSFLVSESPLSSINMESSCELPLIANHERPLDVKETYFMVTKCNSNECEQFSKTSSSFTTPVTSTTTHKTYINEKCALCNNETEDNILPWGGKLKCYRTPESLGFENLKKEIIQNKRCNIIFTPPIGAVSHSCPCGLITKCNQTGEWDHYDSRIEFGCNAFTSIYMDIYRNVFCYMCNVASSPYMECSYYPGSKDKYPTSFSVLLDFRSFATSENENIKLAAVQKCLRDERYDPFMVSFNHNSCESNIFCFLYLN